MNRNYKIATIVLAALVVMVGVLYVLFFNSKKAVIQNTNNQTVPSLPDEDQQANKDASLPATNARDTILRVDNIKDTSQIKNKYNDYINQNYKDFRYYEADGISDVFAPSDKDANLVSMDTFLNSIDANINPKVKDVAGKNYYGLFYCINEKKQKEYGIVLDLNDKDPAKTKSNFDSAQEAMITWEPYLLKDAHNIFFPSEKLGEQDVNQSLLFKDGKYRYAEVDLPNGKSSINYKVVGDPLNLIIVSTSQNCISKAIGLFEALD